MSKNTAQRILVGAIMALIAGGAAVLEFFGFPAVRVLGITIVLIMIVEMIGLLLKELLMVFNCILVRLFL